MKLEKQLQNLINRYHKKMLKYSETFQDKYREEAEELKQVICDLQEEMEA